MSVRTITTIPATISRFTSNLINEARKRRTAGYARVSTDHEEQLTSYEAQVDYYTNYIQSREDWEFTSVYTDEGISATSTAKRDGFNRMVADALGGKIDLIVTKSVSRFARNTVDSLSTIRKLKERGVEVYFEKENIWTFDGKGELLITIMSSLAQEESRSISENCTWGQRKRFSDGKVSVPYKRFLGYDKGENDTLKINEEEAVIVRLIYKMFLEGSTPHGIAKHLTELGYPTPGGKAIWGATTVKSILTNEKMKGDALLQKSYTVDFLTKKKKVNEGEVPQYYVENAHPAIIEPAVFELVQQEMERRKSGENRHSGAGLFASRIQCGECGSWYGSKVWHSTTKYRRTIYQCNHKFKGEEKCGTPHLTEEEIKTAFVTAANIFLAGKDALIADFNAMKTQLFDTTSFEKERGELQSEITVVADLIQKCIEENARTALDQNEYKSRYDALAERYNTVKKRLENVENEIAGKKSRRGMMEKFLSDLAAQTDLLTEFDERVWTAFVDYATVGKDGTIAFTFKNGVEIAS
jgi:DNA invertase Pin-like site-specific DNA recombinase/regulator of replication initiation timing